MTCIKWKWRSENCKRNKKKTLKEHKKAEQMALFVLYIIHLFRENFAFFIFFYFSSFSLLLLFICVCASFAFIFKVFNDCKERGKEDSLRTDTQFPTESEIMEVGNGIFKCMAYTAGFIAV